MQMELLKRAAIPKELAPWPDPDYAVDESWAAVDPYGSEVRDGENVRLRLLILNHAPRAETYRVKWKVPASWKIAEADRQVTIPADKEGAKRAVFTVKGTGLFFVVTADIEFAGRQLREWTEGLARVR